MGPIFYSWRLLRKKKKKNRSMFWITCAKSEAFGVIRLALQGVLGGLQMHSTSKTSVQHQNSCTGTDQLYNTCTVDLTLLGSISLPVHEA